MSYCTKPNEIRYAVAQVGARMHYAVPRILNSVGMLEHLYTDVCSRKGILRFLHLLPPKLRSPEVNRIVGRAPHGVPVSKITAFTTFGWEYSCRRRRATTAKEINGVFLWAAKRFCELVLSKGLGEATGLYVFNRAGLEIIQFAQKRGMRTAVEQTIVPKAVETRLLQEELQRFPDWETPAPANLHSLELSQRELEEWLAADLIVCGSQFVKEGIASCGGPVERCVVVPYGVDTRFRVSSREAHEGALRVLTVGIMGLRKGTPYVLECARALAGKAVFRMVGGTTVLSTKMNELRRHLEIVGPVPRQDVIRHFTWADVFLLPSICEGSATVTYEALASGLPVIATPNAGTVVRDGVDGFIVPVRAIETIVSKLDFLAGNRAALCRMSQAARDRFNDINLDAYSARLLHVLK